MLLSNLNRLVYRSPVSFSISTDAKEANTPVADLATDTVARSGMGALRSPPPCAPRSCPDRYRSVTVSEPLVT